MSRSTKFAVIDVGSNAIRFSIVALKDDTFSIETRKREPLRLGADAFDLGLFSDDTFLKMEKVFRDFSTVIEEHFVENVRACATSAFREAKNTQILTDHIKRKTGIFIETIDGEEEARLIHLGIEYERKNRGTNKIIFDIGGGSLELIISRGGEVATLKSFNIGTVRLMREQKNKDKVILLEKYKKKIKDFLAKAEVSLSEDDYEIIGSGGNIRRMGKIRKKHLKSSRSDVLKKQDIEKIKNMFQGLSSEEISSRYDIRKNRSEVIGPAISIVEMVMTCLKCRKIEVSKNGLSDGMLVEMAKL